MSEETLRQFLARLNQDASFRETVQQDPALALKEFELGPTELAALATGDEDALRRLTGQDVQGYLGNVGPAKPGFLSIVSCDTNDFTVCGWWSLCGICPDDVRAP